MNVIDSIALHCAGEEALGALAARLAPAVRKGGSIHLKGDLGAGKTTFARALLVALGVKMRVKSPTYSLLESYSLGDLTAHHLDLYRIADPGELEWLGLPDLAQGRYLLLIEWPERAAGILPEPDLVVSLTHAEHGRDVRLDALSSDASWWLRAQGMMAAGA
jgi:tRNA threonylcarbamoyladenosine biosynthesis protein TsaE